MKYLYPFCKDIRLHVKGRVSREDARRQEATVREILKRLYDQPGIILADEVGMGKTFVALAVAVSVAVEDYHRRPVVVMVPPSLQEKWPTDYQLFRDKCLPAEVAEELKWATARRAVEFLKLLDDPLERRCRIIFVTHGALSLGLADGWVKLALIQRAIRGRHGVKKLRRALARILGKLLRMSWVDRNGCGVWEALLSTNPRDWLDVLHKWEIDPEHDDDSETDDDPVPRAVSETLQELDTDEVYDALKQIPLKKSKYYNERIQDARHAINGEVRTLWKDCIESLQMRLPLLILDEAHHLKNPETRLASLFQVPEARDDADEITTRGTLGDVFERMLFLTATPFQLGHAELCSVLDRFGAIRWTGKHAPSSGLPTYQHKLKDLRTSLDRAQAATSALDHAWGRLRLEDLHIDGQSFDESRVDAWWKKLSIASDGSPSIKSVRERYASASDQMKMAERLLRPWVIRHLKPRSLPAPHQATPRRERFPGRTLEPGTEPNNTAGLPVADSSLLPFLLAARATSHAPDARPVFAEGLASSYEAFLHTRQANLKKKTGRTTTATLDTDDDPAERCDVTQPMEWYLDHLAALVPHGDPQASVAHPKVGATVRRVVDLWAKGEKVVVFCHYIATGRTLRQRISEAIDARIRRLGAEKLGRSPAEVPDALERLGRRFFDEDSPVRRACDTEVATLLRDYRSLREYKHQLIDVARRMVRTPSFLIRFFPLDRPRLTANDVAAALDRRDASGMSLRELLRNFFQFLAERSCKERDAYIDAASKIQTGTHVGRDVEKSFAEDEVDKSATHRLIPNVRLANGATSQETRQRLMRAFNTPFYPEVLIASSVMAEGVDLHLSCRHVIHHDLCWNPSTLEQRTGRIDRIASKAERCGSSILVYLPYVAATQDEKMYRVVMDRERWFRVVMGEQYKTDVRSTDKLANRVPFPEAAAAALAFQLAVAR